MVKMTKKQWQEYYGVDDEPMARIEACLTIFNGKIVAIKDLYF
jgi:hypothetical protein